MRYPIIHQSEATDCGPAVLAMIAAFYKHHISIARLREIAGTGRAGTTLAGLRQAAEEIGFEARAVRATADALRQITLPAIAHWHEANRNHFVVLYKITAKRVMIADPAAGRRRLRITDFLKCWTGVLLLLTPIAPHEASPSAVGKPSVLTLSSLLLPHYRLFLDALVAAVLLTILNLTYSFFIQALVDSVFVLGRKPALNWLGLGMLLVTLARAGFLALRSHLLACLGKRIDADTVLGWHRHLLGLPLAFFPAERNGEILSRMNNALKIRLAVSATTLAVIVDSFLAVGTAAVMMWLNWQLALRSLQLLPALAGLMWLINRRTRKHQRAAMEKGAEFEAADALFRSQILANHTTRIAALASGLSALGLLWFGGHQVLDGAITIGQLMALHTMLGTILGPLERLAGANQSIQDAIVAADRLNEVLALDPEVDEKPLRASVP